MGEESASSQQEMRFSTSQSLKPFQKGFIDALGAELIDEVIVVDCHLFPRSEERDRIEIVPRERERKRSENVNSSISNTGRK